MATEVILPKLGLTMQEGVIEEWVVEPGAQVNIGDVLMRIGTDKVDADVEAEASGRFHPAVQAGVVLPPGALVAWLLAEGEEPPSGTTPQTTVLGDVDAPRPSATVLPDGAVPGVNGAAAAPGPASAFGSNGVSSDGGRLKASPNARRVARERQVDLTTLSGTGPGGRVVSEDVEDALAAAPAAAAPVPVEAAPAVTPPPQAAPGPQAAPPAAAETPRPRGVAAPLVRRFADELGVELADVVPSGAGGKIRRSDVEKAADRLAAAPGPTAPPAAAAAATTPAARTGQVIPLTGMRGAIARNMHASLQEMAQLTHSYEADVSELIALRALLKTEAAESDLPIPSLNDFLVKAAALALQRHPLLNATVRDDGIHLLAEIHVGFAVAVPDGLVVPVLRDAATRSLGDLAREATELAAAARTGKLTLPQLEGGTFSVSSLGGYGVDFFTPVVSPGNVGILGVGRIRDGVRWESDTPVRTQVMTLSLTFDHRAVDGAPAAEFLRTVRDLLARPLLLLVG